MRCPRTARGGALVPAYASADPGDAGGTLGHPRGGRGRRDPPAASERGIGRGRLSLQCHREAGVRRGRDPPASRVPIGPRLAPRGEHRSGRDPKDRRVTASSARRAERWPGPSAKRVRAPLAQRPPRGGGAARGDAARAHRPHRGRGARARRPGRARRRDRRTERIRIRSRRAAGRRARGGARHAQGRTRRDRGLRSTRTQRSNRNRKVKEMFRLIKRTWHYAVAFLSGTLDTFADPRVQIEQAIEDAKRQHAALSEQAAAVIGNQRELQLKLTRTITELERLRASATQALVLAEDARTKGDTEKAAAHERTARLFAMQLATVESSAADLHELHERAAAAAKAAKGAVEHNAYLVQRQLAERSKLLTELEAAKMQERVANALQRIGTFAPATDVPSLQEIRDRIDRRIARASGRYEIANEGVEARILDVEHALADARGDELLEEIRQKVLVRPNENSGGKK
ncbi:MAG: PspA/IM30 family protein [Chloroflexi bacterium]|nr:MAG: PspA/IM30 family protein [Chloroflexota bacterium]